MALESWIASANDSRSDFPIHNLPYGVFRHGGRTRIGVAIGDQILDLHGCAQHGLLAGLGEELVAACGEEALNSLMSLGPASWSALRQRLTGLLNSAQSDDETRARVEPLLVPMREAAMQLPARIGDYTDFYASIHHATRVGKLLRPDNPLLSNYKYLPIGYHGRVSSIVVSGQDIRRPWGQAKTTETEPAFVPSQSLDYELEVGVFVGEGNDLGETIPIAEAERHIFGLCLLNDWSARDIQAWEYQPLGPFLAKNFATTISPWVVPMEALAPYRVPAVERPPGDPPVLPYLNAPATDRSSVDVTLEVYLQSLQMRESGTAPILLSQGNLRDSYWTIAQLVTHHASNGCNLRPGDLIATGTISGAQEGSEGCLLEKKNNAKSVRLSNGKMRTFLEDGDRVILRGYAHKAGLPRIGFGECIGTIVGANPAD